MKHFKRDSNLVNPSIFTHNKTIFVNLFWAYRFLDFNDVFFFMKFLHCLINHDIVYLKYIDKKYNLLLNGC